MEVTEEINLTERARELLTALCKTRQWLDRRQLASATGKKLLSPHDRNLLEELAELELIDVRTVTVGIASKYEYRCKNSETEE